MTPQKNISEDICGAVILKVGEKTLPIPRALATSFSQLVSRLVSRQI